MQVQQQFSIAYLLLEVGLIATALAAGRMFLFPSAMWLETQAIFFCIAMTAGCGAVGGLCLRMAAGLIAGGVLAVASIPLVWLTIGGASW